MVLLGVISIIVGCRYPPDDVTIDPNFTNEQKTVILDVIDNYCVAVGYCPRVHMNDQGFTTGNFFADFNYDRHDVPDSHAFNRRGLNIYVDMRDDVVYNPVTFWRIIAHEMGHYVFSDHVEEDTIMNLYTYADRDYPSCIDQQTADLWCNHWSCDQTPKSTCAEE